MKKIITMLALGIGLSASAQVPAVSGYATLWKCNKYLTFTVTGPASSWVQVAPYVTPYTLGPNIYNNYGYAPGTTTLTVYPANTTQYSIVAYNNANYLQYGGCNVTVPVRCFIKKIEVNNHTETGRIIVQPVDPIGEQEPNIAQVKWKLEELDPFNTEPIYTIDDADCWADYNHLGLASDFTGFDNAVNNYATGIPVSCNSEPGNFVDGGVYRITRSYRYVGETYWYEDAVMVGPGFSDGSADGGHAMLNVEMSEDQTGTVGVFPNPSKGNFTVALAEGTEKATAEIYSITGQLIDSFTITGNTFYYGNQEKLAAGTYTLRVINGDKQTTQRITVE